MGKLNITQDELLIGYNKSLDLLLDECDWITHIDGESVCGIIIGLIIEFNINVSITSEELYKLYDDYIETLNLDKGEWQEKYGIPEIIGIIYSILETLAE
jgi:hypothetical protein